MKQSVAMDDTSVPWSWPYHLWPLYCAFAEQILRDFGEHRSLLFTGLPKPAENGSDRPLIGDDLSSAYSALNDPEDVKKFGKFYTPAPVVSYVLHQLGYPEAQGGPLLDPAYGTGGFLVEAARRYLASNPEAKWEDLTREIRGIDIDPVAVLIARARILGVALDAGLKVGSALLRIDCRDALALDEAQGDTLFEELRELKEELAGYVVGNPPYGKLHSSDARIAPYRDTVHGHANLYGIFLALAVSKRRSLRFDGWDLLVPGAGSSNPRLSLCLVAGVWDQNLSQRACVYCTL